MTDYGEHCEWLAGEGVGSGNLSDYEATQNNLPVPLAEAETRESVTIRDGQQVASSRGGQNDLAYIESFSDWLDARGDAMAAPDSFSTWLKEREDSI